MGLATNDEKTCLIVSDSRFDTKIFDVSRLHGLGGGLPKPPPAPTVMYIIMDAFL